MLYRQGDINFIVNGELDSQAEGFARVHGASVNAMAFRVKDAQHAVAYAVKQGATACEPRIGPMELNIPAIHGIGDSYLYLVDRYGDSDIYGIDFDFYPDWQARLADSDAGLKVIDHLTHNVEKGNMDVWADFYDRIANFKEIRFFDIEGKLTGLKSRALTAPCGKIRIPINESSDDKSQIAEYLKEYNGEGIQHIALSTDDIYQTVETLKKRGMGFMDTPDTYYEKVDARVEGHGEDVAKLRNMRILIDGNVSSGILLQIFTDTVIGPVFFEIIQRKGNQALARGISRRCLSPSSWIRSAVVYWTRDNPKVTKNQSGRSRLIVFIPQGICRWRANQTGTGKTTLFAGSVRCCRTGSRLWE